MPTPNVNMAFAPGNQLAGAAVANVDNTFFVIGAASKALPNKVCPLVDQNTIVALAGLGEGPELCAQLLAAGAGQVWFMPGNSSVVDDGTYSGGVPLAGPAQSRLGAPPLAITSLAGLPGLPLQPSFTNAGFGQVSFDANSFPLTSSIGLVSVQVTTAGGFGAAVATVSVGATQYVGVVLQPTPWTSYGAPTTSSGSYGSITVVVTGTGAAATFAATLDAGTPWTVNAYAGKVFVDANGYAWPITGNTTSVLTGNGAPAAGANATSSICASFAGTAAILDFSLPPGKAFAVGDLFNAYPTPLDSYSVAVQVNGVNAQGQALYQYCLDYRPVVDPTTGQTTWTGTWSGQLSANLGGVINASAGAPVASWTAGSTFPTAPESVSLVCTQAGTLTSVAFQCSVATGLMVYTGATPSNATVTVTTPIHTTAYAGGTLSATLVITGSGTALGALTGAGSTVTPVVPAVSLADTTVGTCGGTGNKTFTIAAAGTWSGGYTPAAGNIAVDNLGNSYVAGAGSSDATFVATTPFNTGTASLTPYTAGGTAAGTLTLADASGTRVYTFVAGLFPATFTESTTELVFALDSSVTNFTATDSYAETISPPALFTKTVNGVVTTGVHIASTGQLAFSGPVLQLPIAQAPNAAFFNAGASYQFQAYPQATVSLAVASGNARGAPVGLAISFGFGVYQPGDLYTCQCAGPFVANADALNALSALTSLTGYPYSMIILDTGVREDYNDAGNLIPTWNDAMSLASSVNTTLMALIASPTFQFKRALVCGPPVPSDVAGATPTEFIAASGALQLDRAATSAGADYITSVLTGQVDLRNHGVADAIRLASPSLCPVQTDPGEYDQGPLQNVVSTTTPAVDANVFNANRAMVAVTFDGIVGVFEAEGLTLSAPGGDYSTIMNCRVVDKAAYYGRQALLPYGINRRVPTVQGKGTLDPTFASLLASDVANQIDKSCPGNFQGALVTPSLTAVLVPSGTEPVTIAIVPWGYITSISCVIGFSL